MMCGEPWSLWAVACYIVAGLCLGFGWAIGQKLWSLIVK
jgi:hypothetical protein